MATASRPSRPAAAPRVPQQARSRRTRGRILEAAIACFEERGYDATTTAQIARRAGIGVGTLYGYFRDKRELLLELLHETVDRVADDVVRELAPERWRGADLEAKTRDLVGAVVHSQRFRPGLQRILWERYFKDPDFRAASDAVEGRVRRALATLLEALRAEGRVRIHDVTSAAFLVQTSVQWMTSRLLLGEPAVNADAAISAAADMLARFLFGAPPA